MTTPMFKLTTPIEKVAKVNCVLGAIDDTLTIADIRKMFKGDILIGNDQTGYIKILGEERRN